MPDFHFQSDDWQIIMTKFDDMTTYRIKSHTHPMVAVTHNGQYWPENYDPEMDDDGYYLPDERMDCDHGRIEKAYAIAAVPVMIRALKAASPCLRGVPKQEVEMALRIASGDYSEGAGLSFSDDNFLMTRQAIMKLVGDSNLSSLARDAGVSYHALRRMMTDAEYDVPYSVIEGLSRYFEMENKA